MHHLPLTSRIVVVCLVFAACSSQPDAEIVAPAQADPVTPDQACNFATPGHTPIHRLTNEEYNNTLRDLLFTDLRPADAFDPDVTGISGFRNDSNALTMSDDRVAAYLAAADTVTTEFIASKGVPGGAYGRIVTCGETQDCAVQTLFQFASRAWRRPVTTEELITIVGFFNAAGAFTTGLHDAMMYILMSPKFLFEYALDPRAQLDGVPFQVDDYALAARLSYALWQAPPDDSLTVCAQLHILAVPEVLFAQVTRMLRDPKAASMRKSIRNDWLQLQILATAPSETTGVPDAMRDSLIGEVDTFLDDLFGSDRSLLELMSGQYGFMDANLANFYGVPFTGTDPSQFVRTQLPARRTGLVTSAAVLTANASGLTFTHPVHRGRWVMDNLTCDAPSPPPPGIPIVSFDPSQGGTPREKLTAHLSAGCIGCHARMDTLGLGLENYDASGQWRDAYPGNVGPVDASGSLYDGESFTQAVEMFDDLAALDATRACLARHVLAYAVGHAVTSASDLCAARTIGTVAVTPNGSLSQLIRLIVQSPQFQMQTGEAP